MKKVIGRPSVVISIIIVMLLSFRFIRHASVNDYNVFPNQIDPVQSVKTLIAVPETIKVTTHIFYQKQVAVLTYHHLDPIESSVTITPARFKSHLKTLQQNGFHIISMEDFIAFLQKKKNVPSNAVVITFDDGYESVYKYAYPIMRSEGIVATVFLIVGYIEDSSVRQPPILKWKQIIQMHNDGFSFYSHSYQSHESVVINGKEFSELTSKKYKQSTNRVETDNEYKSRISRDLIKANDILNAKLGNRVNLLCLPHGQYNQTLLDMANQLHILYLFTGIQGFNTEKSKLINRINAGSPYMSVKLLLKKLSRGNGQYVKYG